MKSANPSFLLDPQLLLFVFPLGQFPLVVGRQGLASAERLHLQAGQVDRVEPVVEERLGGDRNVGLVDAGKD
jgi:hypothetical protein